MVEIVTKGGEGGAYFKGVACGHGKIELGPKESI